MKRKLVAGLLIGVMTCSLVLTGCSGDSPASTANVSESEGAEAQPETENAQPEAESEPEQTEAADGESGAGAESGADTDQAAADEVADLIDAIYVQTRTDETDGQCARAKEAWDALTDTQKEMVEGENADPDYFGRDTGDASKDDPRNQDEIGENEILVVSFGTSFNDSRVADIKGIEDAIQEANPD